MKLIRFKILFILFALAGCTGLYAQHLTASVSRNTVSVGEQFEVNFAINANASGFEAPSFSNLDVYSGPNESTSVEFVNGNVSQSVTFSYIVAAKQEGTSTIGAATVHAGGKTFTSNEITVKVVKGAAPQNNNNAQAQNNGSPSTGSNTGTTPNSDVKKNLFVRVIPSKSRVYQGEQILLTIKIYTRLNLQSLDNASFPEYNGFYSMDVGQKNAQIVPTHENYNGVAYTVAVLKQAIVFPEHSGNLKIDPATVDCIVAERVKSNNVFDQFFGGSYKNVKYTIKSDPISIDVLPLPAAKNEFMGAVGEFSLKSSMDKNTVKANDAVNLNIVLSGNGNLKLIDSLPVKFPPDFDHYDAKITDHITTSPSGVSGSRTFNYLLIPRHQGQYTLPAEEFTYFDPQKKSYVSLSIPEFKLDVAKGDNNSATTMAGGVNKEDIKTLGQDIRYIHTDHESARATDSFFLYSFTFYAGVLTPVLAFLLVLFARRKYIDMNSDAIAVKQRGATRMAKKRLNLANKHMIANNKEAFYEELLKALNGYLSDKFTIPVSELSRETIASKLTEKKVSPETLQKLMASLDNCEYARYAPATVTSNLNEVYDSTVKLITQLEDEIAG